MKKYVLSAFADEYADSFEDQLAAMSRLGVKYTELRFLDGKNVSALTEEDLICPTTHGRSLGRLSKR